MVVKIPILRDAVIVREVKPGGSGVFNLSSKALDGLTVLLVEDEPDARELIALVLERSGATVLSTANVPDALQLIETHRPDVMISDIGMPGEDGYSLIKKIRKLETVNGRYLPAAALTAYAKSEDRAAALAAGYEEHVTKPIESDRLPSLVADLARRRSSTIASRQDAAKENEPPAT